MKIIKSLLVVSTVILSILLLAACEKTWQIDLGNSAECGGNIGIEDAISQKIDEENSPKNYKISSANVANVEDSKITVIMKGKLERSGQAARDVRTFVITKDNAGSIIQFNADNYKEHNDYIYANATAYISDYYCCAKDFCKIGNRFLSHKNRKYEIRNIEIDSHSEIAIYVYNSEGYSGYAYYDDDLKRIIIIPSIDNDCCVDAGLNVNKEASIVSDSIEPLYIIDVINSLKFKTKSLYFLIESDCFDENNIITKLIEYDWNEGD